MAQAVREVILDHILRALGHGATSCLQLEDVPYTLSYRDTRSVEAYFKHCYEERQRRLGKGRR
jgi:hypothetical protein